MGSWHLDHQRVPIPYFSEDPSLPERLLNISVTPHQYTILIHIMAPSHMSDRRAENSRVLEVEEELVALRFNPSVLSWMVLYFLLIYKIVRGALNSKRCFSDPYGCRIPILSYC